MGFKSGPGSSGDVTFGDAVTDVVKAGGAISGSTNLSLGGNFDVSGSMNVGTSIQIKDRAADAGHHATFGQLWV